MKNIIKILLILSFITLGCTKQVSDNWIVVLIPVEITTSTTTTCESTWLRPDDYVFRDGGWASTLDHPCVTTGCYCNGVYVCNQEASTTTSIEIDWGSLEIVPEGDFIQYDSPFKWKYCDGLGCR
jgi:hypothetical protein